MVGKPAGADGRAGRQRRGGGLRRGRRGRGRRVAGAVGLTAGPAAATAPTPAVAVLERTAPVGLERERKSTLAPCAAVWSWYTSDGTSVVDRDGLAEPGDGRVVGVVARLARVVACACERRAASRRLLGLADLGRERRLASSRLGVSARNQKPPTSADGGDDDAGWCGRGWSLRGSGRGRGGGRGRGAARRRPRRRASSRRRPSPAGRRGRQGRRRRLEEDSVSEKRRDGSRQSRRPPSRRPAAAALRRRGQRDALDAVDAGAGGDSTRDAVLAVRAALQLDRRVRAARARSGSAGAVGAAPSA